jgi:transglutaminase-like putative cysteine protease
MRRARELETLLLAMFAAVPLYFTFAISQVSVAAFHVAMAAIVVRVLMGRSPELIPASVMRWLAIAYVPFYIVDATMISKSAIAASTHLVLFIAAYQPIESVHRDNQAQRTLTTSLIFVASLATSTHVTIIPFVLVFAFFIFRQLMHLSQLETSRAVGRTYDETPSGATALFYLTGAIAIGALLFPMLPRLRSPLVRGFTGPLAGSTSGLTETINLNQRRITPNDATILARVWMDPEARASLTPLRLRGMIYDRFDGKEWKQTLPGLRVVNARGRSFTLARARGEGQKALIELRPLRGKLFLPSGTYAVSGLETLYEGPARETYYSYDDGTLSIDVRVADRTEPLRTPRPVMSGYPISPAVETLARTIVGNEERVEVQAALIEQYMVRNFRYVPNTEQDTPKTLERFLLVDRGGHCEYFAAGMVALMNALGVPARIAGGFYGGQLNPLTGYYAVRREDAHAWTEVWNGTNWLTFDATPPALRPGSEQSNPVGMYLAALSDSLTFFWDRYVLTFGLGDQIDLLTDAFALVAQAMATMRADFVTDARHWFTGKSSWVVGILAVGVLVAMLLRRRRGPFDVLAAYLAAQGIEVSASTTMEEALRRLRVENPEAADELQPVIALYEEEVFSATRDANRKRALQRRLAELKT